MEAQAITGTYGTAPLQQGLPKDVLTKDKPTGPFSFYDAKNFKEGERPHVPCHIPLNDLNKKRTFTKDTIFSDFEEQKTGDLKLIDKELKDKQKGVLITVFKEAASKLVEGKGIVGLSLPVRIFEPRSSIERLADLFLYCNHYLMKAAGSDEPHERIKYIMGFVIAAVPHAISQYKPFNPLLGETFQATLEDGTTIDCEHTSHHPPIMNYYVKSHLYTVYGCFTINGEIHANSINAFNEGWGTVQFMDGHKVKFTLPNLYIWGMIMGSRGLQVTSAINVIDEQNGLKGVLKYSADVKKGLTSYFSSPRTDVVRGAIYKYDQKKHSDIMAKHKDKWLPMLNDLAEMSDSIRVINKVEGSWLREIRVDGEMLWNINDDPKYAQHLKMTENPLPSDCRFREDLIWLWRKNEELAQIWKIKLEEQQRHERALRKKVADKRSPKK
jgi:Oxysterol-binding protein